MTNNVRHEVSQWAAYLLFVSVGSGCSHSSAQGEIAAAQLPAPAAESSIGAAPSLGVSPSVPAVGGAADTFGATPGGAKDIAYARDVIAQGGIPTSASVTAEGLFSEHDLGADGPRCDDLLCLRPALAIAPHLATGRNELWINLALASGISRASFERPPLDLVVGVDQSSSMSIDLAQTVEAVSRLASKMRPVDRLAVFAFDDAPHELQALGPVTDLEALQAQLHALFAGGAFDIDAAGQHAYSLLSEQPRDPQRLRRVMLFSCGYPGVGEQQPFPELVRNGAEQAIGLSFFGVLLGYSPDLAALLGQTHGGSSFYLPDVQRVEQVFDVDFETIVTPIAYDFRFQVQPAPPFTLSQIYGIPGDPAGAPQSDFEVSTVFLSNRGGGMVARLPLPEAGPPDAGALTVGSLKLDYTPEPALGWHAPVQASLDVKLPAEHLTDATYYENAGVERAVALANEAEQMRAALQQLETGQRDAARATLAQLSDYLRARATEIGDGSLDGEVDLIDRLQENAGLR